MMRLIGFCLLPEPQELISKVSYDIDALPKYITEAAIFLSEGQAKKSLQTLNNAPTKFSSSPWEWIVAATAHCELKDFISAREVSRLGLQQVGKNSQLLDCLGVACCALNDYASAQNSFVEAIQADANNTNAIVNLANLFISQTHTDAAFETLQQGLKQNPNSTEIKYIFLCLHPAWIQPIVGRGLRIRIQTPADEKFLVRCFADQSFMNNYHRYGQPTNNLIQNQRHCLLNQKSIHWIIEQIDAKSSKNLNYFPIGLACLSEIQVNHQRAEISIGFPNKLHRGQGSSLTAMLLLMDFAFNRIGFNKLTSIVYGDNHHSQHTTLALGVTQEGFHPNHLRDSKTGQWLGIYDNGLLKDNFRTNTKLARLSKRLLNFDITLSKYNESVFGV